MTIAELQAPRRGRKIITNPKHGLGYIRISLDEMTRKGKVRRADVCKSPEAQRDAITAWAAAEGVEIVAWHQDLDISGADAFVDRPGLLATIEDVRTRRAGVVVVAKRDRLARDVGLTAKLIERMVERAGARVLTANGIANDDNPEHAMMRGVLDVMAGHERSMISARTKTLLAAKKARGFLTGTAPYGQQVVEPKTAETAARLGPCPAEQAAITRARELRAQGLTLDEVVACLDADREAYPPRGACWHRTTVQRILRSAACHP